MSSHKRDFLAITDFSQEDHYRILERAHRLKSGEEPSRGLEGKTLAMIFRKSSTRTRVSFEVGAVQLGGHAVFLSDQHSQMGRGESIHDTAEVLSRFVDGIMIRTFAHAEVEALAAEASVPVINGLTDLLHPCQVVSDIMTAQESFGRDVSELRFAWIGERSGDPTSDEDDSATDEAKPSIDLAHRSAARSGEIAPQRNDQSDE